MISLALNIMAFLFLVSVAFCVISILLGGAILLFFYIRGASNVKASQQILEMKKVKIIEPKIETKEVILWLLKFSLIIIGCVIAAIPLGFLLFFIYSFFQNANFFF